jgi:Bacterial Ig-like domain (group 3)
VLRRTALTCLAVVAVALAAASAASALETPTVSLTQAPVDAFYGAEVTFTATIAGAGATPTGTVQFQVDGVDEGAPVPVEAAGRAVFLPDAPVDVGSTIAALYRGDAVFAAADAHLVADVAPAKTAMDLISLSNPVLAGGTVTLIASVANRSTEVTPFGSVQLFVGDVAVTEPEPLVNGRAQFELEAPDEDGTDLIEAVYVDDTAEVPDFEGATASVLQRVVADPNAPKPPPAPPAPTPPIRPAGPVPSVPPFPTRPQATPKRTAEPVPRVALTTSGRPSLAVGRGNVVVRLGRRMDCPVGPVPCTATVVGRAARGSSKVTIGTATTVVSAGKSATLAFTVNARGRALLRTRHRLVVTARITASVDRAVPRTVTTHFTLKRR